MHRREFMKWLSATGLLTMCGQSVQDRSSRFPHGKKPTHLYVLDTSSMDDYHQKVSLTCLQGLVNRVQPRLYLVHTRADRFWLDYYQQTFGTEITFFDHTRECLETFRQDIKGIVRYDSAFPHSLNLANMVASHEDLLPVEINQESLFTDYWSVVDRDAITPAKSLHSAYTWALENLQPQCHASLIAQCCIHHPHWPTSTYANRDYIMAHNIFCFDLSTSERDKTEYNLVKEIYQSYAPGAIVMGWHCIRDKEHEAIALSSEYGHYGLCSLHTPNLTVHSAFQFESGQPFKQRPCPDSEVENKVYISFMATDGDATWFMHNLINTDWADPLHGAFKYNWGFLPLAYDLMPATVKYYMENLLQNDYFVAGPSGATYTYPHLHPDPVPFMSMSDEYMKKCGLTTVHMTNWNDRDWWQEADIEFLPLLCETMPHAKGFLRGMGESAFEENYYGGCKPLIFCGEGIHSDSDVTQTLRDFIDANPIRPLFIYCLVNHTVSLERTQRALDALQDRNIEPVHVDELLSLIEKAHKQGKIGAELYPEKQGIRRIMAREARQAWPGFYADMLLFAAQFSEGEKTFAQAVRETPTGLEPFRTADILAFQTIWHSMKLVKLSLEAVGIYVNHKPTAVRHFMSEYGHLDSAAIIPELQDLWQQWHSTIPDWSQASGQAEQLIRVAREINNKFSSSI